MKTVNLPKLIIADTERDADQLYATRFFAPDPFIFLENKGRRTIVLSDLEIDRGRAHADVDEVVALSEISRNIEEVWHQPTGSNAGNLNNTWQK